MFQLDRFLILGLVITSAMAIDYTNDVLALLKIADGRVLNFTRDCQKLTNTSNPAEFYRVVQQFYYITPYYKNASDDTNQETVPTTDNANKVLDYLNKQVITPDLRDAMLCLRSQSTRAGYSDVRSYTINLLMQLKTQFDNFMTALYQKMPTTATQNSAKNAQFLGDNLLQYGMNS